MFDGAHSLGLGCGTPDVTISTKTGKVLKKGALAKDVILESIGVSKRGVILKKFIIWVF